MMLLYKGHRFFISTYQVGSYINHACPVNNRCDVIDMIYGGFSTLYQAAESFNKSDGYGDLNLGEYLVKMGFGSLVN